MRIYNDKDVAHRVIYVEASRGCPYKCEYCLSSLDIPVRQFPLPALLKNLDELLHRGVRQFKFVDRTFNLNLTTSKALLQFFLDRYTPGLFVHFEMIPDRLPEALREVIAKFPPGSLQFEVGIQTFNPDVSKLISRRQDYDRLTDNFHYLREHTGVHIHADLIVGLPGESLDSFAAGFDRLVALRPHEIQVGILKRLRGTPIVRHDAEWSMAYNNQPPYEILHTKLIDAAALQRLRRFAKYWDLIANSGNFVTATPLIWSESPQSIDATNTRAAGPDTTTDDVAPSPGREGWGEGERQLKTPFREFLRLSDWLHVKLQRQHSIPLVELAEALFDFLVAEKHLPAQSVAATILADYQAGGRTDTPIFLRPHLPEVAPSRRDRSRSTAPKRQQRHLAHK